ncbi:MAG: FkbM family methyltransferase [Gemmatimonadetes bacterium]|nr:FkbM family methyltransferase [Gemmatimonadota bacterium]
MDSLTKLVRRAIPRPLRNWLRAPSRSLRVIGEELAYRVGVRPRVAVREDWSLRCHPTVRRALLQQLGDPAQVTELDEFIGTCEPEMVLFDIGAHFGAFSLAAMRYGGTGVRIFAVEPSPFAVRLFRVQARLSGQSDGVTLLNAAAAAEPGFHRMLQVGVLADGYFITPGDDRPDADLTTVAAVSIDSVAQRYGVHPTHVKIDVEGFETAVLQGGENVLSRPDGPTVFLELHRKTLREHGVPPGLPLELLEDYGYRDFHEEGRPASPDRIAGSDAPMARIVARKVN